ncbi:HutD family protein [Herbaspirillum sp. HC18]|nr:HutD family protein [Herbaspirillum sp. HC18]
MRKLTTGDYAVMPWKNGGGTTTQLAVSPPEANLDNFDWRISTAHVAGDGPFSAFPGIDRSLAVLRGNRLILTGDDGACRTMGEGTAPFIFRGEQPIAALLENGPIVDFNVMTRRSACTHTLEVLELHGKRRYAPRPDLTLVYVAQGGTISCRDARGRLESCGEGESLLIEWRDDPAIELEAAMPSRVCVAHITFKETRND